MLLEHNPIVDLNLSKQDVERYIISHGWKQVEHPNKKLQVFAEVVDNDGQPIRLVLPVSNDLKDTPLRIYQAVQTIADIEERAIHLVVTDIEKVKAV
jgi:ubiquinone/menaquinone biosynthesis C-methylase UbiE